jgi:hypothetical protein
VVVIGDDAWIDTGAGFRATTANDPVVAGAVATCPGSASFWEDFNLAAELRLTVGEPDVANGVPALRYRVGESLGTLASFGFLPPKLQGVTIHTYDVWLAEDGGWLVSLIMDISVDTAKLGEQLGFPTEEPGQQVRLKMRLDITDPNSPDIRIEPPLR